MNYIPPRIHLRLPEGTVIHDAILSDDRSTYVTICGKRGKFFLRWRTKHFITCRRCLFLNIKRM